jgi:hypothetical protein
MIHESYYWKKELYENYQYLVKFRNLKKYNIISTIKADKAIMLSAYIIRKLYEAEKIPGSILETELKIKKHKAKIKIIDHMNNQNVIDNYDLDNEVVKKYTWKYIINQIIHSFSYFYVVDDMDKFTGILINSDYNKGKEILYVDIENILTILLLISEGDITALDYHREFTKTKDGKIIAGPMKIINAKYEYPNNFNIKEIIRDSMNGIIYKRK